MAFKGSDMNEAIRPLALGVFWNNGKILVYKGYDHVKQEYFYRPIGGGIEFGEYAAETLHREIREEIQAKIKRIEYIGTLENLFTYEGRQGHEIVLMFNAEFVDRELYAAKSIVVREGGDIRYDAEWKRLIDFRDDEPNHRLYPEGLYHLLLEWSFAR